MSLSGLFNNQFPLTLDGTTSLDVSSLTIDGSDIDIFSLVPYVGATKTLDMGAQNIKTTYTPVAGEDVVNLTTLSSAVLYVDTATSLTYLNKITSTPQTVAGDVTFNGTVTSSYYFTDNSYNWGRLNASYNAWSIKRILNGSIIRDLQFKDETDSITTLLLSSSGQTVYVGLTCDYATALKVPVWDANKKLVSSGTDSIKISYLDNVSSDIQTQINSRALTTYVDSQDALRLLLTGGTMSGLLQMNGNKVQSSAVPTTGNDLANKTYVDGIVAGAGYVQKTGDTMSGALTVDATVNVSNRLLGLPDGSPGNFWIGLRGSGTETDRLAIAIVGASTTGVVSGVSISKSLYLSPLTADRALYLDGSKVVTASSVTGTELGYVSGVTSAIQTQINTKASTTYVDTADGLRLLKAGDTATGTLYNSAGDFWPYRGGDTNRGVKLFANNADGATYTTYNGGLGSWHGIGFFSTLDSTTRFIFDTRTGNSSQVGSLTCGSATISGTAGITGQVTIDLSNNVTPNIKLSNSLCHIDNASGEAYLFTAYQGHISVGRNTLRNASTANLVLGTASTEESEIISVYTDNSAYAPMSFASSRYTFIGGNASYASRKTNPSTAQCIIKGETTSQRLLLGSNYTSGAGNCSTIQSSDFYSALDHGASLLLNPLGGNVGIGSATSGAYCEANCKFTINAGYSDGDTGAFCINATDSASIPNSYNFRIYPYVQAGGQVAYQVMTYNGATAYNSYKVLHNGDVSFDTNVGIGTLSPSYKLQVQGDAYATGSLLFGSSGTYDTGCIFSNVDWGCLIRAKQASPAVAIFDFRNEGGTSVMRISKNGAIALNGLATNYAITSDLTTKAGAVNIGGNNTNYDDSWNTGLLMECQDTTGISIHDSGSRLSSFMYYSGNRFYMGRNPGGSWSITGYTFESDVVINNTLRTTGTATIGGASLDIGILNIKNPSAGPVGGHVTHFGYTDNNNYIRGNDTYMDTQLRCQRDVFYNNPPATTTYGSAGYGANLGWDVLNGKVTVNVIEFYHSGPYSNYQAGYWNGVNRTNQFYKSNVSQSVWVSGYATAFISGAANMDIVIRLYNQSTGQYFYNSSIRFTNVANHHTVIPVNINFGTLPAGWYDTYTYWNQFQNADANDYISLTFMLCHGINSP